MKRNILIINVDSHKGGRGPPLLGTDALLPGQRGLQSRIITKKHHKKVYILYKEIYLKKIKSQIPIPI